MSYNIDQVKVNNEITRVVVVVVELDCSLNNGAYQSCFSYSGNSLYQVNLIVLLTMEPIKVEAAVYRLQVV